MSRAVSEYPTYLHDFNHAPIWWDTVTESGVFGDATAATAQKGRAIMERVVSDTVALIAAWRNGFGPRRGRAR